MEVRWNEQKEKEWQQQLFFLISCIVLATSNKQPYLNRVALLLNLLVVFLHCFDEQRVDSVSSDGLLEKRYNMST